MRQVLALAVWIVVSGAGGACAAPTVVAPLDGATTIVSFRDVQVWSDYDPTDSSWHLVVDNHGLISTPPIPAATNAIEADVGPGPSGSPMLVFKVCPSGCHLVVSGLEGSDPRAVPGSSEPRHPTIWGDRVAWVTGANQVMTSLLDGSGRRVLRGAPRRLCQPATRGKRASCEATRERLVTGLKLYYGRLALTDLFNTRNANEHGEGEVLTEAVKGGPQHLIALEAVEEGSGDRLWLGPSWLDGKLYFYEDGLPSCPDRCLYVYGFDSTRDAYVRALASTELTGFSIATGLRAYEATGYHNGEEATPEGCAEALGKPASELPPCVVRLSDPIAFRPAPPPILFP